MSEHRHTLITSTPAERVELHVHTQPEGWSQVLHVFTREHMRRLSIGPTRIMLHMFDRRDRRTGRSSTDRRIIASTCDLSAAAISEGIRTLTTFQPILLAVHSPTEYEVYPGRIFAGAYARNEEQVVRGREDRLRRGEQDFAPANEPCVPLREARAREITHSKTRIENPIKKAEPDAQAGLVSEWPEPDLFGKRAIERGDVKGLLVALRVWDYAAEALAEAPHISIDLIMAEARSIGRDHEVRNKPRYLAGRLAKVLGVNLPDCPGSKRLTSEQLAGPLGNIARLRLERARGQFTQRFEDAPRGMTASEYSRQEDES